ncbi:hypothetical protein [Niastella populi]|nr:hypothetical protein [Niastella populi]
MNLIFIHPFKLKSAQANDHTYVHHRNLHDTSEGSEFLDDAIYREDVQETPVSYTEESGSFNPQNDRQ